MSTHKFVFTLRSAGVSGNNWRPCQHQHLPTSGCCPTDHSAGDVSTALKDLGIVLVLLQQLGNMQEVIRHNPHPAFDINRSQLGAVWARLLGDAGAAAAQSVANETFAEQDRQAAANSKLCFTSILSMMQLAAALFCHVCAATQQPTATQLDQLSYAVQVMEATLRFLTRTSEDLSKAGQEQYGDRAAGQRLTDTGSSKVQLRAAIQLCKPVINAAAAVALPRTSPALQQQQQQAAAAAAAASSSRGHSGGSAGATGCPVTHAECDQGAAGGSTRKHHTDT